MTDHGEPLLVVFDVDGTLVDAAELDNASFDLGFRDATGAGLPVAVWSEFEEITAGAIIRRAAADGEVVRLQGRVLENFLARLQRGFEADSAAIQPFPGAVEMFNLLKSRCDFRVAIATGCWEETARFKLRSAGFILTDVPFASGSDHERRSEIISLAVKRAGSSLAAAVYVGDGVWDLRAANYLGIPFIGVGREVEKLRREDARYIVPNFDAADFLKTLEDIRREMPLLRSVT